MLDGIYQICVAEIVRAAEQKGLVNVQTEMAEPAENGTVLINVTIRYLTPPALIEKRRALVACTVNDAGKVTELKAVAPL
jgi:hypothetical protein